MATVFVRAMGAGAKATTEPTRAEARTIFIMMLVLLREKIKLIMVVFALATCEMMCGCRYLYGDVCVRLNTYLHIAPNLILRTLTKTNDKNEE